MSWRLAWLFMTQTIGVGLGLWLKERNHADAAFFTLCATLLGTALWLAWDNWQGLRTLRWLKRGQLRRNRPRVFNMWAEVADVATTIQRKQERKTTQAQDRLDALLDALHASPVGVVLLNELGRISWFNQIAAEHFGFKSPQDIEQHVINLVRDPAFVHYWMQPHSGTGVTIYGRKHTTQRPVRLSVRFFGFGKGKRLLLSLDITAVEQAECMRRDFVANVSHEIRTPLTVLSGFVETLQTIPLGEQDTSRYLALMAEQAQRMQVLVEDLLTLSRLEDSPAPDTSKHTNVCELVAQCVTDAQALSGVIGSNEQHPMHHIHAELAIEPTLQIAGSYSELRSALSNLLSNAVRYTPAGGDITARAEIKKDGALHISVQDTGPGIPREHLPRITERFYRLDKSRSRETGGTGLGLAIVKHIAQRHHATLDIKSQLGQGSCFTLIFAPSQLLHASNTAALEAEPHKHTTEARN